MHSKFPGFGAAWSAWIVDLKVDTVSGEIIIERVTVGQDTGMMVNPDGVRHQIHGNVIQMLRPHAQGLSMAWWHRETGAAIRF